jgi:hypothetical protein
MEQTKRPKVNSPRQKFTLGDTLEASMLQRLLKYRDTLKSGSIPNSVNLENGPNAGA